MNRPGRKVIDLAQQKCKRQVLDAFDRLEREARQQRMDQYREVRKKAKDAM